MPNQVDIIAAARLTGASERHIGRSEGNDAEPGGYHRRCPVDGSFGTTHRSFPTVINEAERFRFPGGYVEWYMVETLELRRGKPPALR